MMVKTFGKSWIIVGIVCAILSSDLMAQDLSVNLKGLLEGSFILDREIVFASQVKEFYQLNGYTLVWLTKKHTNNLSLLIDQIKQADTYGLRQENYQANLIRTNLVGITDRSIRLEDSLMVEIRFTDAAIHFYHDVLMGTGVEQVSYNGLKYVPDCYDIPVLLNAYISSGRFSQMLPELESKEDGYLLLKSKISQYLKTISSDNFRDIQLVQGNSANNRRLLLSRLDQLGIISGETENWTEQQFKTAVKRTQVTFDLLADAVIRTTLIKAMNTPLKERLKELEVAINSWRWLSCMNQENNIVVVNIPSATLALREKGKPVFESRVIVGRKTTPTPTLSSKVTDVILYPYWNVPFKIATKELLPRIKRNPAFLEANNYQVLNRNGKPVNPGSINWRILGPRNFPYLIRQSTGCDNALGLIKINFYTPFDVYLHDTPGKSLFSLKKRYFSHGCMRLENALDLGRYILRDNRIAIDTLSEKGCLKSQSPVKVPAIEKLPVFVLYNTAWIDEAGQLIYFEDIYNKSGLQ